MAAVAHPADLKRLAFVETAAANSVEFVTGTKVFSKACGYYSSAKETNALKVRRATRLHAPQTAIASRVFPQTLAIWRVTRNRARGSPRKRRARAPPAAAASPLPGAECLSFSREMLTSRPSFFFLRPTTGLPDQDRGPDQGLRHPRGVQGPGEVPRVHDHRRRQGAPTPERPRRNEPPAIFSPATLLATGAIFHKRTFFSFRGEGPSVVFSFPALTRRRALTARLAPVLFAAPIRWTPP